MGYTFGPTLVAAGSEGLRAAAAGAVCWLLGSGEPPSYGPSPAPAINLSCPPSHCECDCRNEGGSSGPAWALVGAALALLLRAVWASQPTFGVPRPAEAIRTPSVRGLQDRTGDLADLPGGKAPSPGASTRSTPTPSVADSTEVWTPSRRRA